jgi:hypothetical protein
VNNIGQQVGRMRPVTIWYEVFNNATNYLDRHDDIDKLELFYEEGGDEKKANKLVRI